MRAVLFDRCCQPRHVFTNSALYYGHHLQQKRFSSGDASKHSSLPEALEVLRSKWHLKTPTRLDIASPGLCDDIIQRLSPFLESNKPCDILDYCPGVGLLSTKIHDYLQPRRHLLIEPREQSYRPFLQYLRNKSSVQFLKPPKLNPRIKDVRIDWAGFVKQYLPELEPVTSEKRSVNNDLLVILNLSDTTVFRREFSAGKTWAASLEDALMLEGFHYRGMVRVLAIIASDEAKLIIPQDIKGRKKVSLLSEALASHLFNVAETGTAETSVLGKPWDLLTRGRARAAQRTADAKIIIPEGRERPPLQMAPTLDTSIPTVRGGRSGSKKPKEEEQTPYVPRLFGWHNTYLNAKKALEDFQTQELSSAESKEELQRLRREFGKRRSQLKQENKIWHERNELVKKQAAIETLEKTLVQVVEDPSADPQEVQKLNSRLAGLKAEFAKEKAQANSHVSVRLDVTIDYRRAAGSTGNFDDAVLPFDRRPFEPLYVKDEDVWHVGSGCNVIYFEPDSKKAIVDAEGRAQHDLIDLYVAILAAVGLRINESLAVLFEKMYPGIPAMDIIKAIPSLFPHVSKRLATSSLATSVSDSSSASASPFSSPTPRLAPRSYSEDSSESITSTPSPSFIEKFDYDFTDTRPCTLPISVISDLVWTYINWPGRPSSSMQINRQLGGSLSKFNSASQAFVFTNAGGKVQNL